MAIVFTKALSETELLNSHNSNTVQFNSNTAKTATKATLDFGDASFEITPSPGGLFDYDLLNATKELLNANNFIDQITPDIENSGYVYADTSLYKLVSLVYTITFSDDTTETTTKNYSFTKSVKQPDRYSETIIKTTDMLGLLIPFSDYSVKSYAATYFKGYPFDVAVYSNISRTVTIYNATVNMSYDISLVKGVNRLFFSDGTQSFSFENDLPLYTGINDLELRIDGVTKCTLLLNKKESGCGPYLKWYSATGGYSYFLFNDIYTDDKTTKIISTLESTFASIEESTGGDWITGKDSANIKQMFAEYLTADEMGYLETIFDSPRVALYTREVYQAAQANSWRGVVLKDATHRINHTKKVLKDVRLAIAYTNETLKL